MTTDHGKQPYVVAIEKTTLDTANFRTTLWTGAHLQLTVLSIPVLTIDRTLYEIVLTGRPSSPVFQTFLPFLSQ